MSAEVTPSFEALGTAPHLQRFCLWTDPGAHVPRALIVHVPAFAEEMNKSRRMVALQSRAFADAGAAVLQIDLLGCGDSAGESGDATWAAWVDDVVALCALAVARFEARWPGQDVPPLWLWGLRGGALLAVAAAKRLTTVPHFIFWQPALSGRPLLQQFLRLASLGAAIGSSGATEREPARTALAAGRPAWVAGYSVAPSLALGLEQARLEPAARPANVLWLTVSPQPDTEVPLPMREALADWRQQGHEPDVVAVVGPQFWQTVEAEDAPALIGATTTAWAKTADLASEVVA